MLKKVNTSDRILALIQDNVDAALSLLIKQNPMSGGNVLSGVSLKSGQDNLVAHKLGKAPSMWIVAGRDVNTSVWSPATATLKNLSADVRYINLRCGSNCTITLWVA